MPAAFFRKNRSYSLRTRLLTLLSVSLGLLVILILLTIFLWVDYSNEKIADSNQRTLDYCAGQINSGLAEVDSAMTGLLAASADYTTLFAGANRLQAHVASHNILRQLLEFQRLYPFIDCFMVYSAASSTYRDIFSERILYRDKQNIEAWIFDAAGQDSFIDTDQWHTWRISGTYYLMRFYGSRGTYLIALTAFPTLGASVDIYSDDPVEAIFCLGNGTPLTDTGPALDFASILTDSGYTIRKNPDCMVLHTPIENTDAHLLLLIEQEGFLSRFSAVQFFFGALLLYSVTLLSLLLHWVRQAVAKPLDQLEATISEIRSGNPDAAVPAFAVKEFNEVGVLFNEMMEQNHRLKMVAYEKELETQKAQQQYLQLQIRPHFYLNCLKELYAIADRLDVGRMQSFILSISGHLRYIFRDQEALVPLKQELEHIRHYIDIQKQISACEISCTVLVPDELMDFPIPPLTLSTFAENSCKHRDDSQKSVSILVKAELLQDGETSYVSLSVRDNGKGFSEMILKEINQPDTQMRYESQHVGIRNIKQRFRLIYGDAVMFAFYNTPAGPVSEIYIPYHKEGKRPAVFCEEGERQDDHTDC